MATYWVDHAGSNTAPYDTQAKAATTLATILAIPPAAPDIIYCCDNAGAGEVIAGSLTLASSGSQSTGWIKVIGCNSSGVVDGTRYVIDANNNNISCVDAAGYDWWWFENIEVKNTGTTGTLYGFNSSTGNLDYGVFINCKASSCDTSGWRNTFPNSLFYRCMSTGNIYGFGDGGGTGNNMTFAFCAAYDNSNSGFYYQTLSTYYGCIAHGNTEEGWGLEAAGNKWFNCVSDGNADNGIEFTAGSSYFQFMLGCRITNHSGSGDIGINAAAEPLVIGHCYFEDNDDHITEGATNLVQLLSLEGGTTDSNLYAQADTNEGYVDKTNHDFSTNYVDGTDPTLRRVAITIPWT